MHLHWEDFLFVALRWLDLIVTEHKDVSARGVTVKVTKEEDVSTLKSAFHHQLCVIVDGVELAARADPLSVKILSHQ